MFRLLFLLLCLFLASGFVALPIERAANSSRVDAHAADGIGGWLDLGSHDLGVLPAGETKYAGVSFVVPPSGDETAESCIVIGRSKAETAVLKLNEPVAGPRLYLLHAVADAPAPERRREIGKIVLRYTDGKVSERPVCVGQDVSEWMCGRSFENAARAWTEYNGCAQVSLFVSQFKMDEKRQLVKVSFVANGTCPWMVVAATVGEKTELRPVRSSVEPTGAYKSPEPPTGLGRFPGKRPKSVIVIVGDGMGQGAARITSYYKHGREDGVYFQQLPVAGLCATIPANAPVTDSAAAATAFATGTKTSNGVLGLLVDAQHPRTNAVMLTSVAERAHAQGRGVAILTSDPVFGATAAAYYAHATSRGDTALICQQASESGFEVLVGSRGTEPWFRPETQGGKRKDGRDLVAEMDKKGYAFVHTPEEMASAPAGKKILGSLTTFGSEKSIGEAVKAALDRVGDSPKGFFMMAECGDTDHACHRNNAAETVKSVTMVEFMAAAAVDFARARGDTLVIVTADHDTGHPVVLRDPGTDGRLNIQWTDTSHTKYPVPVHAYGPGAELFEGLIDNTDIAKNIARLLELPE